MKDIGAQLILIDTAVDVFAGNENIRPQVRQFINSLRAIATENDGAVVLTSHPSRAGLDTGDGTSGSTGWHNTVRSRLYLKPRSNEPGADANQRLLVPKKANYGPLRDAIRLAWRDGVFVPDRPAGGIVGSIERQSIERAFIAALTAAIDKGFEPSFRVEARSQYAPKLLHGRPEVQGYTVVELERAMKAALAADTAVVGHTEGPPSRRKKILVPAGHMLAAKGGSDTPTSTTDTPAK